MADILALIDDIRLSELGVTRTTTRTEVDIYVNIGGKEYCIVETTTSKAPALSIYHFKDDNDCRYTTDSLEDAINVIYDVQTTLKMQYAELGMEWN